MTSMTQVTWMTGTLLTFFFLNGLITLAQNILIVLPWLSKSCLLILHISGVSPQLMWTVYSSRSSGCITEHSTAQPYLTCHCKVSIYQPLRRGSRRSKLQLTCWSMNSGGVFDCDDECWEDFPSRYFRHLLYFYQIVEEMMWVHSKWGDCDNFIQRLGHLVTSPELSTTVYSINHIKYKHISIYTYVHKKGSEKWKSEFTIQW